MNKEIKAHITPLFQLLCGTSINYMNELLESFKDRKISGDDLMGLIISAHFSSLRTVMLEVANGNDHCTAKVERFMETVYECMKKSPLIKKVVEE